MTKNRKRPRSTKLDNPRRKRRKRGKKAVMKERIKNSFRGHQKRWLSLDEVYDSLENKDSYTRLEISKCLESKLKSKKTNDGVWVFSLKRRKKESCSILDGEKKRRSSRSQKAEATPPKTLLDYGFSGGSQVVKTHPSFVNIETTDKKFDLVLADPPWQYNKYGLCGEKQLGQCEKHYKTLSLEFLKKIDVDRFCNEDCILLLWATGPKLGEAFQLMTAWGFIYLNVWLDWHKTNSPTSSILSKGGLGKYSAIIAEHVLLGVKGKALARYKFVPPMVLWDNEDIHVDDDWYLMLGRKGSILKYRAGKKVHLPNVIHEKVEPPEVLKNLRTRKKVLLEHRRSHSTKPKTVYNMIEKTFSKARTKIELFARNTRKGWHHFGNQC